MSTDWSDLPVKQIIAAQGWDNDTLLSLYADFIEERDLEEDLRNYLAEIAADEEESE